MLCTTLVIRMNTVYAHRETLHRMVSALLSQASLAVDVSEARPGMTPTSRSNINRHSGSPRLDPMVNPGHPRIAVIGAGISGLAAARHLHDRGYRVEVFEKARGLGGRATTRRADHLYFNQGAPYFSARDPAFRRPVAAWLRQGVLHRLNLPAVQLENGAQTSTNKWFVARPGMSALARHIAAGIAVHTGVQVASPQRRIDHWRLSDMTGRSLGRFDLLIIAVPAPQARRLLELAAPALAARAGEVSYVPTWTVLLAADHGAAQPDLPPRPDTGPVDRVIKNRQPGQRGVSWVLHANADWSAAHPQVPAAQVADELATHFCNATDLAPAALSYLCAHHWRYARVTVPLTTGALWDPDLQLGLCGDWCCGGDIEGAWLSGRTLAAKVLE